MRAGLPKKEPEIQKRWEDEDLYGQLRRAQRGPGEIHPARRAALRQRQHPYRHRPQQDSEGSHQPDPADAGQGRQLRPRLGLPRPAHRVEDRGAVSRQGPGQGCRSHQRFPARVPRVRRALDRRPARGVQAPRCDRPLGRSLPDDEVRVRGADRRRADEVRRQRQALSRLEAGHVVGGGAHGAGGGRSRIFRP